MLYVGLEEWVVVPVWDAAGCADNLHMLITVTSELVLRMRILVFKEYVEVHIGLSPSLLTSTFSSISACFNPQDIVKLCSEVCICLTSACNHNPDDAVNRLDA